MIKLNENEQHCKRIAEDLKAESLSLYDYFEDNIYNIDYICNGEKELTAVRVMVACGGPNIYINTWDRQVELFWWTESAKWPLDSSTCDEINAFFEELWNC